MSQNEEFQARAAQPKIARHAAGQVDSAADLSACEREPIHIPGAIQPFGVLVAVSLDDFSILQVSENAGDILGIPAEKLLKTRFEDLIGSSSFARLRTELSMDGLHSLTPSTLSFPPSEHPIYVFYHCYHGFLIAEFEPKSEQDLSQRGFWDEGELPFGAIYDCEDVQQLGSLLVREIRRWTGFDRVILYRFDEDWHGVVLAEEKNDVYPETYLGHHFPASDIPAQARKLFALNRLRVVPQVDYVPARMVPELNPVSGRSLDMSMAMLRNVSPVHLEYLQNMGVGASMTISLLSGSRLWGMVTCHHRASRSIPHSIRLRCKVLGELASYTIAALERRNAAQNSERRREKLQEVSSLLDQTSTLKDGLTASEELVLEALDCDGLIVRFGDNEIHIGETVAQEDFCRIQAALAQDSDQIIAFSRNLAGLDERLNSIAEQVSGALYVQMTQKGDFLLALRREMLESRTWAGNPNKPAMADPGMRIHPRKSFEKWQETIRCHSRYWHPIDTEMALELKRLLLARREQHKRRRVEQALRESEAQFRATFEQAAVGVAHVGLDGHWLQVNQKLCEILGYRVEELSNRTFQEITHPDDLETDVSMLSELIEGKIPTYSLEKRYVRKNGVVVWANLTVSAIRDDTGVPKYFIAIVEDVTKRKQAEEHTNYLANHDPLTGLPNRAHFSDRLHDAMARANRERIQFALLMLDLDRFKSVNDTLGHHVGDLLLKEVAARLQASVRETDVVARLGGDEFVIIQNQLSSQADAEALAHKIVRELDRPYLLEDQEIRSGTSVGVTLFPHDARDQVELLKNADLALYRAKDQGRHNFQFYTRDLHVEIQSRRELEDNLRRSLDNNELQLYYQPIYDLDTMQFAGVEALLRWQNPKMQMMAASSFLELAEESGLILPIGEWVLSEACRQAREWHDLGVGVCRIGVNFSLIQMKHPSFAQNIRAALEEHRLAPQCLEIELTEGQIVVEQEMAQSTLADLKQLGVRICADDFGAGLSSLSQLRRLPVDVLKIDRSIVQRVPHSRHDAAVASAIIGLAQDLNIRVVAEGVETLEQLAFLKSRGCTSAQGFLFSPPVSAQEVFKLIDKYPSFAPA